MQSSEWTLQKQPFIEPLLRWLRLGGWGYKPKRPGKHSTGWLHQPAAMRMQTAWQSLQVQWASAHKHRTLKHAQNGQAKSWLAKQVLSPLCYMGKLTTMAKIMSCPPTWSRWVETEQSSKNCRPHLSLFCTSTARRTGTSGWTWTPPLTGALTLTESWKQANKSCWHHAYHPNRRCLHCTLWLTANFLSISLHDIFRCHQTLYGQSQNLQEVSQNPYVHSMRNDPLRSRMCRPWINLTGGVICKHGMQILDTGAEWQRSILFHNQGNIGSAEWSYWWDATTWPQQEISGTHYHVAHQLAIMQSAGSEKAVPAGHIGSHGSALRVVMTHLRYHPRRARFCRKSKVAGVEARQMLASAQIQTPSTAYIYTVSKPCCELHATNSSFMRSLPQQASTVSGGASCGFSGASPMTPLCQVLEPASSAKWCRSYKAARSQPACSEARRAHWSASSAHFILSRFW